MPAYGLSPGTDGLLPWSWAEKLLTEAYNFWLATTRPDGRPHLMPVWCLWQDGGAYFSCAETSRKAKNLAHNPNCVIGIEIQGKAAGLSVEGVASIVTDYETRVRVAGAYTAKYNFAIHATESGVSIDANSGDSDPLWFIQPTAAFGNDEDFAKTTTRWRFDR
jgi:hypothetical protein